jgi:hypothetical protein
MQTRLPRKRSAAASSRAPGSSAATYCRPRASSDARDGRIRSSRSPYTDSSERSPAIALRVMSSISRRNGPASSSMPSIALSVESQSNRQVR